MSKKPKAYIFRLNLDNDDEREIYNAIEKGAKGYTSSAEYIKRTLHAHYRREKREDERKELIEEIGRAIRKAQEENLEMVVKMCFKMLGSTHISEKGLEDTWDEAEENKLPDATEQFPDQLEDVLDIFKS